MRSAAEVAHHHPEAVVERHRDADAILLRVLDRLAHEKPVVQDVVMRERRAFGEARRAGRVLDVDGIVELQDRFALLELEVRRGVRAFEQRHPVGVDRDGLPQRGAVGPHLLDHLHVVARPERLGVDQQGGAGLHERIPELGSLVRGVDVDEDGADARGGELRQDPLEPIRRPDADTVALPYAGCEQRAGQDGRRVPQLAIRRPVVLRSDDERVAIAETLHRAAQVIADRLAEQRSRARTVQVRVHDGLWPYRTLTYFLRLLKPTSAA